MHSPGSSNGSPDPALARDAIGTVALELRHRRERRAKRATYEKDPVAWLVDVLGVPERTIRWSINPGYANHRWDGTPDPLVAICDGLAQWQDVGVEAGTGTQKTFTAAGLVLWFLDCFEMSQVITTATREKQLEKGLWKEVGKMWPRFKAARRDAELTSLRVRMRPHGDDKDAWAAYGTSAAVRADEDSATKAQGAHAEHMLIVFEEMPGIDPAVTLAYEQTCTAPHNLRLGLGNPDHQQDPLHQFSLSPGVRHVRISALDHPNVVCNDHLIVPGAASAPSVEKRRAKYGEDSRLFQSRVRGISPAEASDALIKWAWCVAAGEKTRDPRFAEELAKLRAAGPPAMGVDVANSENGDKGAIARGIGAVLLEVQTFPCPDSNVLGKQVGIQMDAGHVKPECVGIDVVGVGVGTVNELKAQRKYVQALNGGEAMLPGDAVDERYANLRSQMQWQMREDLQFGRIALPYDEELFQDLCAARWEPHDKVITVESKKKLKIRLRRSPDKGDAVVYWNWVRQFRGHGARQGALVAF